MANNANKTQNKNNNKSIKEEHKKVEKVSEKENILTENTSKKERKNKNNDIKKEEKKIVDKKKRNDKLVATLNKIDDNRMGIILFVIGFLIATLLFRCIFWPDRIATLKDGTQPVANINNEVITADDLYSDMKKYYSVKILLNKIDAMVLDEKYPENDEMKKEVQSTADYYFSVYEKNYGYTKEKFLTEYGFASEKDFLESLTLDYRRNKYYEDYALGLISDKEINKYYEDEVFGDVDSKHILVNVKKDSDKDGLTDEEAKKLAEEIIDKLNKGTSWDEVIKEYDDKITHEELGYRAFNDSLESSYLKECRDLEVNSYSKKPVLTSYGYHIVYKINQKEKPKLDDIKDEIKEILAEEKKSNDNNLYNKSLIHMRDEANLEFIDSALANEYKKYMDNYK